MSKCSKSMDSGHWASLFLCKEATHLLCAENLKPASPFSLHLFTMKYMYAACSRKTAVTQLWQAVCYPFSSADYTCLSLPSQCILCWLTCVSRASNAFWPDSWFYGHTQCRASIHELIVCMSKKNGHVCQLSLKSGVGGFRTIKFHWCLRYSEVSWVQKVKCWTHSLFFN